MYGIFSIVSVTLVKFPPARREDVLVAVVPTPLDNFAGVTFVLFHSGVANHTHVVVDVEVEERTRLSSSLIDDEFVERMVVWNNEVLLDIHQAVDRMTTQFWKLATTLFQELANRVTLLTLQRRESQARRVA